LNNIVKKKGFAGDISTLLGIQIPPFFVVIVVADNHVFVARWLVVYYVGASQTAHGFLTLKLNFKA